MPSVAVNMGIATQTLVAERLNAKIKPSAIFVDNVGALAAASLTFNDVFTPSVTNAVPIPVLTTRPRLYINIAAGTCVSTQEELLKDVEFIGLVQIVRSVADALCLITFIYEFI